MDQVSFTNGISVVPLPLKDTVVTKIENAPTPGKPNEQLKNNTSWRKFCLGVLGLGIVFQIISFIISRTDRAILTPAQVDAKYASNAMAVAGTDPDPVAFLYTGMEILEFVGLCFLYYEADSTVFSLTHSSVYGGLFSIFQAIVVTCLWMDSYVVAIAFACISFVVNMWAYALIARQRFYELSTNNGAAFTWDSVIVCHLPHAAYAVVSGSIAFSLLFALGQINGDTFFAGLGEDDAGALVVWIFIGGGSAAMTFFFSDMFWPIFSAFIAMYQAFNIQTTYPHTYNACIIAGSIAAGCGVWSTGYLLKFIRHRNMLLSKKNDGF